jgi:hypothetical protein
MWDYNIDPAEIDAVLKEKSLFAGHYNKEGLLIKLLESYNWFTILQLFTCNELNQLLTNEVINKLRFKSLRTQYQYVQKRLQEIVPITG